MKTKNIIQFILLMFGIFALSSCASQNEEPVKSSIFIERVEGLSQDFIFGADISTLLSLEASGCVFYNFDGEQQDVLLTLSESGFNYIRVRVWNDPFDSDGNGYGGGNCNVDTAAILGARAAEYGMKLLVNFHYSDFWADPSRQQTPKAWRNISFEEKETAIYNYTMESLHKITDSGADIGMVQIGNETTNSFCGESAWPLITRLLVSASKAVRDFSNDKNTDIQIVIHFTNPESYDYVKLAMILEVGRVDYDILATSYHPFWHGRPSNVSRQLIAISEQYDKKVMVVETGHAYSWDDFDGHSNVVGEGAMFDRHYPLTIQGQATALSDVVRLVSALGDTGLGVFYWEPAWIPVPGNSWDERSRLWEQHGGGWATSYAAEYDKEAAKWFGGNAMDNQALFDKDGHPLPSLKVFEYCYTGSVIERKLDNVPDIYISIQLYNPINLPKAVEAVFNDETVELIPVKWNVTDAQLLDISNSPVGVYKIDGIAQELPLTCFISMEEENYLKNHSFERSDRSMWILNNIGDTEQLRFQEKAADAHSGNFAVHFWDDSYVEFTVEQTVTGLQPGSYNFTVFLQGGDTIDSEIYIYARTDGEEYRMNTDVDGWVNWRQPVIEGIVTQSGEITVGVYVRSNGGWGTMDDFLLNPS